MDSMDKMEGRRIPAPIHPVHCVHRLLPTFQEPEAIAWVS